MIITTDRRPQAPPTQQNGKSTPLTASAQPQNAAGKRPDGAQIRPDTSWPATTPTKPGKQAPCARPACQKLFEQRRPNQKHCTEKCRKLAHIERHDDELREAVRDQAIQPLLPLLEEFAAAPEQLRALRTLMQPPADAPATIVPSEAMVKAGDEMFSRIATLAERAAVALADLRSKK
jgi:hypothetical protein